MYFGNIDEFGVLDEAYEEKELLALSFWCLWGNRFDWNDGIGTKGVNFVLEAVLVWSGEWNISVLVDTSVLFRVDRYLYISIHKYIYIYIFVLFM